MRIKIIHTQPKSGGGQYVAGEVYEFPNDVARRWITEGKAEKAEAVPKEPKPKKETDQ